MLMKKISLLLVGLLAMFSCEQEDLEGIVKSDTKQVQTRAVTSIADFDPISELYDIPVNIMNVGNTSRRYLSCEPSGNAVVLYTKDDGSMRQRWYIRSGNIILVGGNSSVSSYPGYPTVAPDLNNEVNPILRLFSSPSFYSSAVFTPLNNNYYTIVGCIYSPTSFPATIKGVGYLQSDSQSGTALKYKSGNSTNLASWEISPVGEYELVDLEYVYTSVDNFNPTEVICDRDTYENQSSSVVTWNYTVTTRYTESSSFSKTEGVSVSISNGVNVGLPSVGGTSIGINTTMQQQTNKSWTYGDSNTKEITKTRTSNIPVQPHTTMRLEAVVFMYEGAVTYVATLRKIGDTKTFKVKGKWEGACYSDFKARTYDVATNKLLHTYNLD